MPIFQFTEFPMLIYRVSDSKLNKISIYRLRTVARFRFTGFRTVARFRFTDSGQYRLYLSKWDFEQMRLLVWLRQHLLCAKNETSTKWDFFKNLNLRKQNLYKFIFQFPKLQFHTKHWWKSSSVTTHTRGNSVTASGDRKVKFINLQIYFCIYQIIEFIYFTLGTA